MLVLDHERLDVYRLARELSREVGRLMKKARYTQERPDMVDQVNRATASIPLNLAEGTGETSVGRRAYFYRVARSSATELSAALDHMVDLEMLAEDDVAAAKALILRIVSMLYKLVGSVNKPDTFRRTRVGRPFRSRRR